MIRWIFHFNLIVFSIICSSDYFIIWFSKGLIHKIQIKQYQHVFISCLTLHLFSHDQQNGERLSAEFLQDLFIQWISPDFSLQVPFYAILLSIWNTSCFCGVTKIDDTKLTFQSDWNVNLVSSESIFIMVMSFLLKQWRWELETFAVSIEITGLHIL